MWIIFHMCIKYMNGTANIDDDDDDDGDRIILHIVEFMEIMFIYCYAFNALWHGDCVIYKENSTKTDRTSTPYSILPLFQYYFWAFFDTRLWLDEDATCWQRKRKHFLIKETLSSFVFIFTFIWFLACHFFFLLNKFRLKCFFTFSFLTSQRWCARENNNHLLYHHQPHHHT